MAEALMQVLPEGRCAALRLELKLLDDAIEAAYPLPEDRVVARIPDTQGLGGAAVP
jgi:hypothetical protein